jgi:putative mRNA 3-end processing factor
MVKITFLGACHEVGRSGVIIESEETGDAVLCDYGVKTSSGEQLFPEHVSGKSLSAIVLTHSHIDHTGGLPLFYISGSVPLYSTELTFRVTEVLLHDMLNISRSYLPFEKQELVKMARYANFLNYGVRKRVGKKSWITLFNAGHIPGSAMVLVEMDGKSILYTGDINHTPTQLVKGVETSKIPKIDAVITETTYGISDHEPRLEIEKQFQAKIDSIIQEKGVVLVPAFGVSRSQEIAMVVCGNPKKKFPVTIDGMVRKITHIYLDYPDMFRDKQAFKLAINKLKFINQRKRDSERNYALSVPGVIIASSGMLKGGISRMYAENLLENEKNGIFMVSYQIEGTPGRFLLDTKKYIDRDPDDAIPVSASVEHFDFSSHSGKLELFKFLDDLKFVDKKKVFCVHGDDAVLMEFAGEIKKLGYEAETPLQGQKYII